MTDSHSSIADLYLHHHTWLKGWLRSRLECSQLAADLAQDTFVRVLARKRQRDLPGMREPRAYLRVIAQGLMVDHFRRKSLEQAYLEALSRQPEAVALSSLEREMLLETLDQVDAILDRQPARAREAFLMAQLDGCCYAEIAERFGVSTRTIKRDMKTTFAQLLAVMVD